MKHEVRNTWEQLRAAGGGVAICWHAWHSVIPGRWAVLHMSASGRPLVTDRNEEGPWVRNRQGNYVPERINDSFPVRR